MKINIDFLDATRRVILVFSAVWLMGLVHVSAATINAVPNGVDKISGKTVSLEELLRYAFKNNPSWKASRLGIQVALEDLNEAGSWDDPKIRITHFIQPVETRLGPQERIYGISQRLPFFGESSHEKGMATAGIQNARWDMEESRLALRSAIKKTYFEIWRLEKTAELLKENQAVVKKLSTLGVIAAPQYSGALRSVFKAQAQLGQDAYDLLLVEERLSTEKIRLNALIGKKDGRTVAGVSPPTVPDPKLSLKGLIAAALKKNPGLRRMDSLIQKQAHAEEKALARGRFPTVELSMNYIQIGLAETSVDDSGKDALGVGLGINIPFGSSRHEARRRKSVLTRRGSILRKEQRSLDLREKVSRLYYQFLNSGRLKLLFKDNLLPQAERSEAIAERRLRVGQEQSVAVLEARSILLNFRVSYLRAQTDYLKALADLERTTGVALESFEKKESNDKKME